MGRAKWPVLKEKFYTTARLKWGSVCTSLEDLQIDVEIVDEGYIYYIPRDVVDVVQLCDETCSDCTEPQLVFRVPL